MHRKNSRIIPALAVALRVAILAAVSMLVAAVAILAFAAAGQANAAPVTAWQVKSVTEQANAAGHLNGAPAQEWAACQAAYHYHHVNVTPRLYANRALWQRAYDAALNAAKHADPGMRRDIDNYVYRDTGWEHIAYDCYPDA